MGELDGKVAVVTGGASGIGKAIARVLVREGAQVVVADVQLERAQQVCDELGTAATCVRCDVAREDDVAAAVDSAVRRGGRLDCMVNNAGFGGVVGPIDALPADEFDATVAVLLRGVFLGMKHAARVMRPARAGTIISTSSVAGILAGLSPHVYAACKAAVIQLTRSVAMELGEVGIRVNCVAPGAVATPLVSEFLLGAYGRVQDVRDQMARHQPIPRPGLPEDVAEAVAWLCGPRASFVNGHTLVVDGGLTGGVQWRDAPGAWMHHHTPMRRP